MSLISRINWALIRRYALQKRVEGFQASITSMVDSSSSVGRYCHLGQRANLLNASLGDYSYCAAECSIKNTDIGKFCSIGPNTTIGGLGAHPTSWISTHPIFYSTKMQVGRTFTQFPLFEEDARTTIGNDVWIGARCIILDGARIHDGAIIAAGSVVKGEVEPYAIVGGVPAKVIRYRFERQVREALLDLAWWNRDEQRLERVANLFTQKSTWEMSDILFISEHLENPPRAGEETKV